VLGQALLVKDSSVAAWSEGARVAPERPRAGKWVEGGHHAIGQAAICVFAHLSPGSTSTS